LARPGAAERSFSDCQSEKAKYEKIPAKCVTHLRGFLRTFAACFYYTAKLIKRRMYDEKKNDESDNNGAGSGWSGSL
jgi:hypothetical protein